MILSYLKIAFRNLVKNGVYSSINIVGLALGLACVFLIVQYLRHELRYDRFHENAENIYRITWEDENPQTRVPHPMALALVQDFSQVENGVSLTPLWGPGLTKQTFSVYNPEKDVRFDEMNILAVDTPFFQVFTFPVLKGDPRTALKKVGGLLISESMAQKYFGDEDPVGKQLALNNDKELLEITAVFKDVPQESHFHFDFLISYVTLKAIHWSDRFFTWSDFGHYDYIVLKPGTNARELESKLLDWARKYIDISPEDYRAMTDRDFGFRLQPLTDIHLRSHLRWELEPNGNIDYVIMMTAAALLILVIACINFVNLTTAQSTDRTKEIGIRKTLGALRTQLSFQFIGESVLISCFALILAAIMVEIALPVFDLFTGEKVQIENTSFFITLSAMAIGVGLLAGIYPSLYLSSLRPGPILKGKFFRSPKGAGVRKVFTVLQFVASMILICSSLIIYSQLNFIQHKELGFDHEQVIVIPVKDRKAINSRVDELRSELLKTPGVKSVSAASNIPGRSFNQHEIYATNDPQHFVASSEAFVDYDFFETLDIDFLNGRSFDKENPADKDAFIINETVKNNLNLATGTGEEISWNRDGHLFKGQVIGVVKDFHFQSLHEPIRPLIFRLSPEYNYVLVKLSTHELDKTIDAIGATWKEFDDKFRFDFSFLNDQLNQQYASEKKMGNVLVAFSCIAVAIACFGLFGIASLTFRHKTKEVSIRKVLGASVSGLMIFLAKDFTRMVLLSVVLAIPLVWWLMNGWLQNFTFRTHINPFIFVGSGILLVIVSWLTLAYLTLKIAAVNPSETLKSE